MSRIRLRHHTPGLRVVAAAGVFGALLLGTTNDLSRRSEPSRGAGNSTVAAPIDPREALPPAAERWVEETLQGMDLRERAGQVLMVRVVGDYYPADADQRHLLTSLVQELGVGGLILFRSQAYEAAALLADLQRSASAAQRVPLLVAADFEWGADFRIGGAVPFPTAMAVGATGDPGAAEWMGRASGRDARALGIHWIFAPVADVNVNPRNPVINVRAFGEDPQQVGAMVAAFVRGAQQARVLSTAKHFPGHGDTAVDSHLSLPVLEADTRRLQAVELAPFRAAIDAGVASIMTAHIAVPALTADVALPATLSAAILTDLLRRQMLFQGLVVTDAMEMGGISRRWWSGQAAVETLAAGADVILLPPFVRAVHAALVRAAERGELAAERLEEAVRRVLSAKARLGFTGGVGQPPLSALPDRFALARDAVEAQRVSDSAITLLRDKGDLLPLDSRRRWRVAVVGISDSSSAPTTDALVRSLRQDLESVSSYSIDSRTRGDGAARIVTAVARADVLVMAVRVRVRSSTGTISLPTRQASYAEMLADLDVPTVVVALGSPYAIAGFPQAETALSAYGWSEPLQRAVARAVVGAIPIRGHLPVTVPGLYKVGYGLQREVLDAGLQAAEGETPPATIAPGATGGSLDDDRRPKPLRSHLRAIDFEAADQALQSAIADKAFPGAVYAIGHRNTLVRMQAHGRHTYDSGAKAMRVDAIFDLASLTKVVATTSVAMRAVEVGALRLDYPVAALVSEFSGDDKDQVTVRSLLTHTSGLPAYVEFFRDYDPGAAGPAVRQAILQRIYSTPLEATPGTRYAYSDLGIILLGEVLTRALGEPFWQYAEREVFGPLEMHATRWLPPLEWRSRIPPTERDPWRGRLVWGHVHDENTYAMGGIAPHAGLFSTAGDLAIFAQTLLNGGTYRHHRTLRRNTIESWTRRQGNVEGSSRALGWDTARPSEMWSMFSPTAYGHTGFTGTSLWLDPSRELFVVLLTNRVHPSRESRRHLKARIDFHQAVVTAVDTAVPR